MSAPISKNQLWAGRILSALLILFLLFDGIAKLFKPPVVIKATTQLGYAESIIVPLGVVLTLCTIIYAIPRTAMLGAILLTGYLGGAVNTHVRKWQGWFPVLFPVIVGVLVWGGLYLRENRLPAREILPQAAGKRRDENDYQDAQRNTRATQSAWQREDARATPKEWRGRHSVRRADG
jgi:hypothetical protein